MCLNRFEYVCAVICCTICVTINAISLDNTKTTLSVSNPISGAPPEKDGKDLRRDESRYNEPAPEFYKGPTAATLDKDRNRYGFQSANDGAEHRYDAGSSTNAIPYGSTGIGSTSRYWSGNSGYGGSRDRLNVGGYYGSSGSGVGSSGYGYDRQRGQYGPPQTVDLPGGSGYYAHGTDYGHGGYSGSSYGSTGHDMWSEKWNHLSKSNLIPIASAALLGIAAAFIFNPVLLQLGTISAVGKRRRRDVASQIDEPLTTADQQEYSQDLAYKGQNRQ